MGRRSLVRNRRPSPALRCSDWFGGRDSEFQEQAKPFERGGRGEREERQKNLKLSALFAPSAFNGLEDWAAAVCTSIFPVLPNVEGQPRAGCAQAAFSDDAARWVKTKVVDGRSLDLVDSIRCSAPSRWGLPADRYCRRARYARTADGE